MKRLRHMALVIVFMFIWAGVSSADPKYPPFLDTTKEYYEPTESQKLWALATCAVLTESNYRDHNILGAYERTPEYSKSIRSTLAQAWGIHNRDDLMRSLNWIEEGGHRKGFDELALDLSAMAPVQLKLIRKQIVYNPDASNKVEIALQYKDKFGKKGIAAWDFARYVALCGWGYAGGFISEDEAWRLIMPAARLLQNTFTSWEELGTNHVVGREFWSLKQTLKNGDETRDSLKRLTTKASSPWKRLDWNMDLNAQADKDAEPATKK